ncbi:MAG: hypothetical protein HYT70_01600 [Candidatus Aenigmarchaeota archaeon]|nr:hypothetical protein [Candidatus Aenigmarchaeota archaeon]
MAYRKGQLSIDFYVALIIFLSAIAYVVFQLVQVTPATLNALREENIRIQAYQISELLVNDGGHPNNWGEPAVPLEDIRRIGFSDTSRNITNFVSSQKIQRFKTICDSNYNAILNLLNVDDGLAITIINHDTQTITACRPPSIESQQISVNITRVVSIDGSSLGEILVEVWRR